jgi:hypothetical protein
MMQRRQAACLDLEVPADVLGSLSDPPPAPPEFRHCVAAIGSFDSVHRGHRPDRRGRRPPGACAERR